MNKLLVILEQNQGQIKKISGQLLTVAAMFGEKLNLEIEAVIFGDNIIDFNSLISPEKLSLTFYKNPEFNNYSPSAYQKILLNHINNVNPQIILFGNTSLGKDLAPRIAAKTDTAIAMDCVDFTFNENEFTATRPVYAGKAFLEIKLNGDKRVITIRPNNFKPITDGSQISEIITVDVLDPDLSTKVVEVKKSGEKLDVAEADIVISGGRGLKEPANFKLIEELAEELGAAVGASRAVVDAGWRPHSEQVGQTGKTISPNLYIAVGISGAIQHLAGMRSSKCIVAINKDKDAPIFQVADYGIAGDAFEILPALLEEIRKNK